MRQPAVQWLKGVEDTVEHMKMLRSSLALKQLKSILDESVIELSRQIIAPDFDSPSWACKQAYLNGQLKQLTDIRDNLLGFLEASQ